MSRRRQPIIIDFEATICRADSDPSEIAQGVSRGTRYAHSHTVSEAAGKLVDRLCLDRLYTAATIRGEWTRSSLKMLRSEHRMSARTAAKGVLLKENRAPRHRAGYGALMAQETF
ncbi:MAG: hypothetical protein ACK5V7_11470 [bacterium]|jgi:hypothetical protein